MATPTLVTLKGVIRTAAGPVAGRLTFSRDTALYPADPTDGDFPIPEEVVAVVGADGILQQPLYSCNDPLVSPTGWTWNVRPHFPHWVTAFSIVVPYDAAGGEVNFNRLAPVPPDGDGDLYALANHTHSGGGGGGDDITASQISDSTAVGRALITAANATAGRTTLGLGGAAVLAVGTGSGNVAAGNAPAQVLAAATAADVTTLAAATAAATTLANAALASATAADVTILASATAAATALASAALASATAADVTTLASATAAAATLANAALASATAADAAHVAASDPHTQYARVLVSTTGTYTIATGAEIYVGLADPGSVGVGSQWIDVDPTT